MANVIKIGNTNLPAQLDQSGFSDLFDSLYKPLCIFTQNYVIDLSIAEDIVQGIFVKLWEQRGKIHFKESPKVYLYQAARNESLNYLKHKNVKDKYKTHIENVSNYSFFTNKMEEEELNNLIYLSIQKLPPKCKKVFELSRLEDKSYEEIASELNISKNTVKNQLIKALKQIRLVLEKNDIIYLLAFIIDAIFYFS